MKEEKQVMKRGGSSGRPPSCFWERPEVFGNRWDYGPSWTRGAASVVTSGRPQSPRHYGSMCREVLPSSGFTLYLLNFDAGRVGARWQKVSCWGDRGALAWWIGPTGLMSLTGKLEVSITDVSTFAHIKYPSLLCSLKLWLLS